MIKDISDFVLLFTGIVWEALPFIVLGALIAGILEEFLPKNLLTRIMPKRALPAVVVGGLLGLMVPMCECGIVVVMRRLLKKGLPLACCVAYMLAGPIVNVIVLTSTYVAFLDPIAQWQMTSWQMVIFRAGFGFLIATITGLVVFVLERRAGIHNLLTSTAAPPKVSAIAMVEEDAPEKKKSIFQRISNVAGTAMHDFMDITVFLIIGAALAASAKYFLQPGMVENLSVSMPYLSIPVMMLMAVVMCLCSEADAFVAASFRNMAMSSKLAFLVLGPMLDLKLLMMYTRVFKLKLILTIATCTSLLTLVFMSVFHFITASNPSLLDW